MESNQPEHGRKATRKKAPSKKQVLLITLTTMTVLAAVAVAVSITLYCFKHKEHFHGFAKSSATAELYQHAAVAADSVRCSEMGRDFLKKNGSVVDAAIATSFCLGLFSMHSTGIGGGGVMLVYKRGTKTLETFDYRETAPGKSREDMFVDEPQKSKNGGLAVGVPGEVKGLYEAYKKYHNLEWKDLIQPTIDLAENGYPMTLRTYEAADAEKAKLLKDPGLRKLGQERVSIYRTKLKTYYVQIIARRFLVTSLEILRTFDPALNDEFKTIRKLLFENGKVIDLGQPIINKPLANTLRKIAQNPEDFYTGSLAENIVKDVQDAGGIMTLDDLANYKVVNRKVLMDEYGDMTINTVPSPYAGPIVTHILNILKGYSFTADDLKDDNKAITTYHRIIEAFKFGYAQKTKSGDPEFMDRERVEKWQENMTSAKVGTQVRLRITDDETHNISYYGAEISPPTDHGTTHLSIYGPNGDAVTLTSTINDWYGAGFRSLTTGILYNDEMDDFSTPGQDSRFGFPPTAANYIKPNKRPVSSMVPVILTDKQGDVKLIIGGSGGTHIITAVVQGIMYATWFADDLGTAVVRPRIHHQLVPDVVGGESNRALPKKVLDGLVKIGHVLDLVVRPEYSSIQAIYVESPDKIYAKSDPRKYGYTAGF